SESVDVGDSTWRSHKCNPIYLWNCGRGNAYVSRGRSKKILIRRENLSFIYSERLKQQRFKAHKQQHTTSTLRDRIRKLQSWQNLLDLPTSKVKKSTPTGMRYSTN